MRSVFDALMIATGLLIVTGCALPNRSIARRGNIRVQSTDSTTSKLLREDASDDRFASSSREELDVESVAQGPRVREARNHGEPPVAAHDVRPADYGKARRTEDSTESNIKQTSDQGSMTGREGSVVLQGLEFDEDQTLISEPKARHSLEIGSATIRNSVEDRHAEGQDQSQVLPWFGRPGAREAGTNGATNASNIESTRSVESVTRSIQDPSMAKPIKSQLPVPWQAELEQLISRVEQDISSAKPTNSSDQQSESLRRQAYLRMLYLMDKRQQEALTAISGADASQQEFWQQMIWAMSNSLDTAQFPDASERAAQAVPPLTAALRQMREEASLSIKNMAFCRKISYFGNYERFPRNEFTPGYGVLLYTEIENFVSSPTVDGEYRTSLKSLIEIVDSSGKVVWTKGFPSTEDFCRNPRRDYFHNYQFHFPQDLSMGKYTLKLTITDELSHKRATNSLSFVLK